MQLSSAVFYQSYKDIISKYQKKYLGLHILRSLFFSIFIFGLWNSVISLNWVENIFLFGSCLSGFIYFLRDPVETEKSIQDIALALEIRYPQTKYSIWDLDKNPSEKVIHEWEGILSQFLFNVESVQQIKLSFYVSTLVIPLVLSLLFAPIAINSVSQTLKYAGQYISLIKKKPTLNILQGHPKSPENKTSQFNLTSDHLVELDLAVPNLIEIVSYSESVLTNPIINLHPIGKPNEIFQSFKMNLVNKYDLNELRTYKVTFSIQNDVSITMPHEFGRTIIAQAKLQQLPYPKVNLSSSVEITTPWHDENPLNLVIKAKSDAPMKTVKLLIKVGKRVSEELVNNITSENLLKYETTYSIVLENYINEDVADVEIVAQVVDASIPEPLIGYSNPIFLKTESAYGRYKHALQILKNLKYNIDKAIDQNKYQTSEEELKLIKDAVSRSADTPYFDHIDRFQIESILMRVQNSLDKESYQSINIIKKILDNFLLEHEIIDDRERDRDFFVASRALSRLINQDKDKRPITVDQATNNLIDFIETRRARWNIRVQMLQLASNLPQWQDILVNKPFIHKLRTINQKILTGSKSEKSASLLLLSELTNEYRSWIEDLEKQEDLEREKQQKKRQQGLASARKKMKILQRRQGKISYMLDKSDTKEKKSLVEKWPLARLKQNTNIKETRKIIAELKALSPRASQRLEIAHKAMKGALQKGEQENFIKAETYSDLAGRLLRQAEKDSLEKSGSTVRKVRKRVTGDQYYGQSIHGGDLEISREYQVDKKYREEILGEFDPQYESEDDKRIIENYLRKIVR